MTGSVSEEEEIARYLRSGDYDPYFSAWPGDFCESATRAGAELKSALTAELRKRTEGASPPALPPDADLVALTRRKIGPMIGGLFPARERERVLSALERSVVFLTPATIVETLTNAQWLGTAWNLANLYLGSVKAELLSPDAPRLVGLSEGTTCYVSAEYFEDRHRFADLIVHETAHVLHNCKRRTIGLPETRSREWLLELDFRKRETFAYACEAYSRILELASSRGERVRLLEELAAGSLPDDERVDAAEYLDILRDALTSRNGWKRILARCGAERPRSAALSGALPRRPEPRGDLPRRAGPEAHPPVRQKHVSSSGS
ncbi:MAG: hypothetical protein ACREQ9_05910 [Candidatus Binatia bacterium]